MQGADSPGLEMASFYFAGAGVTGEITRQRRLTMVSETTFELSTPKVVQIKIGVNPSWHL
jgi:hypothetical protein